MIIDVQYCNLEDFLEEEEILGEHRGKFEYKFMFHCRSEHTVFNRNIFVARGQAICAGYKNHINWLNYLELNGHILSTISFIVQNKGNV